MKKIHVGIDISKEKCNLCFRSGLEIVREEECSNEVRALKKAFKAALKALGASVEEVLVCAEYAFRYSDKAIRYRIPDAALVSMKNLLADREFLLIDRKRYQSQLSDQKKYMAPCDFKHKNSRWKKVIKSIDEQIAAIDAEIESLIAADPVLTRQKELLVSIDSIVSRISSNDFCSPQTGFPAFA